MTQTYKDETLAIHAGYSPEPTTKAVAVPIYQTTSYAFDNTQHGADLFDLKVQGNIYTRIMNPTTAVLEQRIAALEGGIGALALASGMAAITYAIQTITEAGDNIASVSTLYGGTYNLFAHTLPKQGIEVRFFDYQQPESLRALIDDKTKLVFVESIGNPLGNIIDLEAITKIAHEYGVPVIVDNTVATPVLQKSFDFGADIIVHSLTKYIGGHGNSIGGVIVDSGKFPWGQYPERFKVLNTPDPSYHGVNYVEALGPAAYIARARVVPLRNTGAAISPLSVFLILQGLETLSLRVQRHVDNTLEVAKWLEAHPQVEKVNYPGLKSSPSFANAQKYLKNGYGAVLSFQLKGDAAQKANSFIDSLELISHLANVGDTKSLIIHPAATTHQQLSDEDQANAGVFKGLLRLSVGIEHIDDIKVDLQQAFDKIK
ncbi:MAG TPA: O-acetylhomoserine aminocarboxypropyltransferase [Sphingobacterium sp.]|nr:O-acetylhomoserine aminocarboxypropyltransferase [Sphingobacterium sp.]